MRVYEFARSQGKTTKEVLDVVNKGRRYNQLSAQSSISEGEKQQYLHSLDPAAHSTSTETDTLVSRAKVQEAIDKIVSEYGYDWCNEGVETVNEILSGTGLSIDKRHERGYVSVSIHLTDMPTSTEFEQYFKKVIESATSNLVFNGKKIGTYHPWNQHSHVDVVDLEED